MSQPRRLPLFIVRSSVVFPHAVATLHVSRPENLAALARQKGIGTLVAAAPLVDPEAELSEHSLARTATLCRLMDRVPLSGGTERVVLEGLRRVRLTDIQRRGEAFSARAEEVESSISDADVGGEPIQSVLALVRELAKRDPRTSSELARTLERAGHEPERFADLAASRLPLSYAEATAVLDESDVRVRLELLVHALERELSRAQLSEGLRNKVQERLRREFLREQLAVIQGELGQSDPVDSEAREFEARVVRSALPEAARERAVREIAHFRRASPGSAEASRIRNWIEWVLELPWKPDDEVNASDTGGFARVAELLDKSHTSLADVKNRVVEFLAVRSLDGQARGTVLCFVGPAGTGKTSMARAVADALGRPFVHVTVAGVSDAAELAGAHLSQPGAVPGRILQGLHRARAANPVVLLDEIDKTRFGSQEGSGGVLLSILDDEQNASFFDHYLGVPFDLSRCVFLATANDLANLPEALIDRLEVIRFGSYTETEKLAIARDHLLPRARANAGLTLHQFRVSPAALEEVVRNYSEEAGVRQLARTLDSLARKAAVRVVQGLSGLEVKKRDLLELIGPANVDEELHLYGPRIGVTAGLAWTTAGGAMLPIEALAMPGSGRVILTGSLGDVMRESVQTAISWVRSRFAGFQIREDALETLDLHLHFPSGATPKDGPSAGIAVATSLLSLLTKIPVRHDVAMTGEMSLLGAVLPVGGMREKLLAAARAGIREVIAPARNSEEVLRLSPEIRRRVTIHLVEHVEEALALALAFAGRSRVRTALAAYIRPRRPSGEALGRPGSTRRRLGRAP